MFVSFSLNLNFIKNNLLNFVGQKIGNFQKINLKLKGCRFKVKLSQVERTESDDVNVDIDINATDTASLTNVDSNETPEVTNADSNETTSNEGYGKRTPTGGEIDDGCEGRLRHDGELLAAERLSSAQCL